MNNLALKIKSATFDCVDKAVLIRDGADWTVPGKQTANTHTLYARKPAAHTQMAEVTEPVIVSSQKGLEALHLQTVAPSHPHDCLSPDMQDTNSQTNLSALARLVC